MFATLFTFIDTIILNNIAAQAGVLAATITPLVGACVVLYVVFVAYKSFYNPQDLAILQALNTFISLSACAFIAFNTPWYLANIVPAVLGSGDNIAQALIGTTASGGGAALQAMFDNIFLQIEDMFNLINFDLLSPQSWVDGLLIYFQMFIVILGVIPFLAVATAYLLVAKVMVSFLLIIGPIFIMMAFFPSTRSFFQAWTGQCFNYTLLSLMYPLAFTIFNEVLDNTIFASSINFISILMTPVIFFALIALSVQIPTLCSTLSGGIGINGLVGGLGQIASASGAGAGRVAAAGIGVFKGGRAVTRYASNVGKGKIKAG